jgi:two-component system CitB family sensor kinase
MRDGSIQGIVEEIRSKSRYQYIIVMDMGGIQYSYPYESGLYKHYKNGGEDKVLQGSEAYFLADTNRLISAIRVFQPIYYNNEQVGAVLIGLLSDEIQKEIDNEIQHLAGVVIGALLFGIAAAILLSLNIKKATFGLEPKEMAVLAGERNLILHSIERGIVAIDKEGKLLFRNKKASLLLDMPMDDDITMAVSESAKAVYLIMKDAIGNEQGIENEKMMLGKGKPLLISVCLMHDHNGKVTGAVANLENMTQVQALAEELTGYRALVDSLRAQNH